MKQCPCGSNLIYPSCCGQYLNHQARAKTPEALMRSRYTAYTLADFDYIKKTMQGKPLLDFNENELAKWAKSILWLGLQVIHAHQNDDQTGSVEFIARYLDKNFVKTIHEVSQFQLREGSWFYTEGTQIDAAPIKVAVNALCPCGSKKKFKHCHGKN